MDTSPTAPMRDRPFARASELLGLDGAAVAHGLRLALAAWLAFAIASSLDVRDAYWAVLPVWIVSQPGRGHLFAHAFLRLSGALVGAVAGFGILLLGAGPTFSLMLLGVCVGLSVGSVHMLRGARGEGALMAGMTAAVVVLPSVLRPDHLGGAALTRIECVLVGVLVASLVTGLRMPRARHQDCHARVRQLAEDTVAFAAALPATGATAGERRLLRAMGELQAAVSRLAARSAEGYRQIRQVDAIVVEALAVIASGRALAQRLRRAGMPLSLLAETEPTQLAARFLATSPDSVEHAALLAAIGRQDSRLSESLSRLAQSVQAFGREPGDRGLGHGALTPRLHRDLQLAVEAAVTAGGITFAAALIGHVSGWITGELAAVGVCILALALGSMPVPAKVAPGMLAGVGAGIAAALLYRLTLQPHLATAGELFVSLAPFFVVGGILRAGRCTGGPALGGNICFLLASQPMLPVVSDPVIILNETAALMLAAGAVAFGYVLLPAPAHRRAARASDTLAGDLERMAAALRGGGADRRTAHIRRQMLRLSLHVEHAADAEHGGRLVDTFNLADAIGRLQTARSDERAPVEIVAQALVALRGMADDPGGTAERLEELARIAFDKGVADTLLDAAVALRGAAALFAAKAGA